MSSVPIQVHAAPRRTIRELIAAHPLLAFFILTFAGPWLLNLPAVVSRGGLGLLPFELPFPVFAALFILGSFAGPTVGAVVVTACTDGRAGVRRLLKRVVQWRVGLRWYVVAFLAYPVIYLLTASATLGRVPLTEITQHWSLLFTVYLPATIIFPALINLTEEIGWRGYGLMHLQRRIGPLPAAMIIGILHGLWHLPVFLLISGPAAMGPFKPMEFALNTFAIMVISIIWAWVFNQTGGSVLIATLVHASGNAAQALVTTAVAPPENAFGYTNLGVLVGMAVVLIVVTRGRLGYRPERMNTGSDSTEHV